MFWAWVGFNVFVAAMLVLDLGVFHRTASKMTFREAAAWSAMWIGLALSFAALLFFRQGRQPALEFVTGYVIEQSLSVDNLFVFLLLFSFFKVLPEHQYRVLFWGIVGAIIMRMVFILVGVAALHRFHWIIYIFGVLLIYSGIQLALGKEYAPEPEKNPVLNLFRRFVPVTPEYVGGRFLLRREGRLWATPLFAVLLIVETTDVIFAVDSIPAVLAITRDAFIVYTSNIFAILGLRAMFFALSGMMEAFHFLNYGLAFILSFVGVKMLFSSERASFRGFPLYFHISTGATLAVIGVTLAVSIAASVAFPREPKANSA